MISLAASRVVTQRCGGYVGNNYLVVVRAGQERSAERPAYVAPSLRAQSRLGSISTLKFISGFQTVNLGVTANSLVKNPF
jgi:hypothetical protein